MAQTNLLPTLNLQGHRGCRGLLPENTIPAFLKAIDLGVTTLEMDVVITKDKQVLVSHEAFFNAEISTKSNGVAVSLAEEKLLNIYQLTYAETQLYDVGLLPHKRFTQQEKIAATKPLLDSVIKTVIAYCTKKNKPIPFFNIETKCLPQTDGIFHPKPAEFVKLVMHVVEKNNLLNKVTIQSFDRRTLQVLKAKKTNVSMALLVEGEDKTPFAEQIQKLGFVPNIYSPHFSLVNAALIKECAALKVSIIPWTVNDIDTMKKLILLGVDGIISDYPNLFAQLK